jgi:hypothetical protein
MTKHEDSFTPALPQPDQEFMRAHLAFLFDPAFVHPYPDAQIEIAFGKKKPIFAKLFSAFTNPQEIIDFAVARNLEGNNVYVGATLKCGDAPPLSRTTDDHFSAARCLYADHDDEGNVASALRKASAVDLPPAAIVYTGTKPSLRAQTYYLSDKPITDGNILERGNQAIAAYFGSDASVFNRGRLLRLAGTVTHPPEGKAAKGYIPELVKIRFSRDKRAHSPQKLIGLAASASAAPPAPAPVAPPPGQIRQQALATVNQPPAVVQQGNPFKIINDMALKNPAAWVYDLFGANSVEHNAKKNVYRIPSAALGRANEEDISIHPTGIKDFGIHDLAGEDPLKTFFRKPGGRCATDLVIEYGLGGVKNPDTLKQALLWLCERMQIAPQEIGWKSNGVPERTEVTTKIYSYKRLAEFEDENHDKREIIRGLLAYEETTSLIAPPKSCKSAVAAELAVHAAGGLDYHGFKNLGAVGVVYFALERQKLTKRRIIAHRRLLGLPKSIPLIVCGELINLTTPGSDQILIETLRAMGKDLGIEIGLAIFDTKAKIIAGAGGDEDKARDRGITHANLQRVRNETGIHTLLIGHTGKDPSRGERGSNSALGDDDVQMTITKQGDIFNVEVTAANDMDEGHLFSFRSEPFVFGQRDDGSTDQVHIVASADRPEQKAATKSDKLTPNQKTFFAILCNAGSAGLTVEEWNAAGKEAGIGGGRRATFFDLRDSLKDKGFIREYGGKWRVNHSG